MAQKKEKSICDQIDLSKIKKLQPFAVLLIANKRSLKIKAVSDNLLSVLKVDQNKIIDKKLSEYFDEDGLSFIEKIIKKGKTHTYLKNTKFYSNQFNNFNITLVVYLEGDFVFFEIERDLEEDDAHYLSDIQAVGLELDDCESSEVLYQEYLTVLSAIVKSESIMIYQYMDDYSGKVVAQKKKKDMPSFINHFFPATDTPVAVREAFMKRPIRYIPDINYSEIKLISNVDVKKLNLTRVISRSVSPVHIEFLKNMGSSGVMTLAIISDNKLWGLVAIHFKEESFIDAEKRSFLILITSLLGAKITYINELNDTEKKDKLLTAINSSTSESEKLDSISSLTKHWVDKLVGLVACDGYIWSYQGNHSQSGKLISQKNSDLLYKHYVKKSENYIYNINFSNIKSILSDEKKIKVKQALLIIISYEDDMYILLCRKSKTHEKKWAGDPNKNLTLGKQKGKYHPRKSFKTWVESHQNEADLWSPFELMAAKQIQRLLVEKTLRQQLTERALHDPLTNLYNRFYLEDNYEREVKIAKREKSALSLCIIDIDFFKKVNDQYGHDAGDLVLQEMAEYLLSIFRVEDTICRYGGEEFVILMRHADNVSAKERCEEARNAISKNRYNVSDKKKIKITISAGVVTTNPFKKDISLEALVKKGDKLLYSAKEQGRNRVLS